MGKICNVCLVEKEYTEFYSNKGCADGYQNRCKPCTIQKSKEKLELINSDPMLKEKERERHRQKYHRLEYKEKHKPSTEQKKEQISRHKSRFPEKYLAKNASQRLPKLVKENNLHHWSYNKEHWKDCIELTVREHNKAHRFIKYDQERFMYRRATDNVLLDTRERHLKWITYVINNFED